MQASWLPGERWQLIDQKILGSGSEVVETGKVDRLRVLGASEGGTVPTVHGRMRVPGNVIWASNFKETSTVSGGGGKGELSPLPWFRASAANTAFCRALLAALASNFITSIAPR